MTTQPPDPQSLNTWEDAFQYPLPVVRKLEQQLRKNIDEDRQKLRSLVGTSYRDLLGTAERIIDMDEQIQQAESYMVDIGRKCNARALEMVADNHVRMKKTRSSAAQARYRVLAQTKVLQSAIAVTIRIVKRGGDALMAAKLSVLARLLHKTLTVCAESSAVLEELRKKLTLARKRLLAYVARSLVQADAESTFTVNVLCAYSLMTSSSTKDVLRYFLQVRFEQLESLAETPSEESILEMLELYSRTLLETREVFPRRFADSLAHLSKVALLRNTDVQSVSELSLDIYEQWIADDVRNFHSWVRPDQLSSTEVGEAMTFWTKQAQQCLLRALGVVLNGEADTQAVLGIRRKVLSKYLSLGVRLRSDAHTEAIHDIRKTFLTRLVELAAEAASMPSLELGALTSHPVVHTDAWDLATENISPEGGAIQFRKAVIERQHGRDESVLGATRHLDVWMARLTGFANLVSNMRATKWDDDLDPDLDLDDLEEGESLQIVLSKEDPGHLEARLNHEATLSIRRKYQEIEKLGGSEMDPATPLRVLREVDRRRRGLEDRLESANSVRVEQNFIAASHRRIADAVCDAPVKQYGEWVHAGSQRTPVILWDGSPPLPVQPTPATFRFLRRLHRDMSGIGNDVWSPQAVRSLKVVLAEKLGEHVSINWAGPQAKAENLSNGHTEAESQADDDHEREGDGENKLADGDGDGDQDLIRHRVLQQLFDTLYLQRILETSSTGDGVAKLIDEMKRRLDLEDTVSERLKKNASDYWKRTHLLFGLLASGQR